MTHHDERDEQNRLLDDQELRERMDRIRHRVIVLSGKGGVGKSTVATNLAVSLMRAGCKVGLLDVDLHGPSIPRMLQLDGACVPSDGRILRPVEKAGLKVLSIAFFLAHPDDALIWRGPRKAGVIRQFLKDAEWGDLDYLIIDSPPGTGDEPLSVCQLAAPLDGAVVVTTPQEVSTADVRKSIAFCRTLDLRVLGVVENMSGFACPQCGTVTEIFKAGGGERMARDMGVPFLGRIPIDSAIGEACDAGTPFVYRYGRTPTAQAFERIADALGASAHSDGEKSSENHEIQPQEENMKVAIPVAQGRLCSHFGHCEQFALVTVDPGSKRPAGITMLTPPPHEPGVLPRWLSEQGAQVIIAGGMGQRAQSLFTGHGIQVVVGAQDGTPEELVAQYLAGTLATGPNVCDH